MQVRHFFAALAGFVLLIAKISRINLGLPGAGVSE
jgi:hypothetical protein